MFRLGDGNIAATNGPFTATVVKFGRAQMARSKVLPASIL